MLLEVLDYTVDDAECAALVRERYDLVCVARVCQPNESPNGGNGGRAAQGAARNTHSQHRAMTVQ